MQTTDQAPNPTPSSSPSTTWWDWDRLTWRRWVVLGAACATIVVTMMTLRWTMPYLHGDMAHDLVLASPNHDLVIHMLSWSCGVRWLYYAAYAVCLAAACMARNSLVFLGVCLTATACATTALLACTMPPAYRAIAAACARGDRILVTMAAASDGRHDGLCPCCSTMTITVMDQPMIISMTGPSVMETPRNTVTLSMTDGIYMLAHYVPPETATTALYEAHLLHGASVDWAWPLVHERAQHMRH